MDSLRGRFNTLFDYNLEQQHEELKRFVSSLNHHTEPKELEAITEKTKEAEQ